MLMVVNNTEKDAGEAPKQGARLSIQLWVGSCVCELD